jgi:hypothetical protein
VRPWKGGPPKSCSDIAALIEEEVAILGDEVEFETELQEIGVPQIQERRFVEGLAGHLWHDQSTYGRQTPPLDYELTCVEAGSPMGELLRRYWQPI